MSETGSWSKCLFCLFPDPLNVDVIQFEARMRTCFILLLSRDTLVCAAAVLTCVLCLVFHVLNVHRLWK